MDRTDFVKIINSENLSATIVKFFDEIMILYNLVGGREDLQCIESDNNASIATFRLLMDSEEDASLLYDKLNNSNFRIYDINFSISMVLSGTCLMTTIAPI